VVSPEDFPLLRHLYEIVALDLPVDIPWSSFFGGETRHDQAIAQAPGARD
jgi:hypothetical protein